jgi:hypothetical protein
MVFLRLDLDHRPAAGDATSFGPESPAGHGTGALDGTVQRC